MADDDTFDIDIYGDDDQGVEQEQSENLVQQGSTSTEANGGPLSNRERALDEQGGDPKPEATATDRIQQADPNGVDTSSLHDDPGMHLDGQSMDNTPFGTEERDSRPVDVDATKAVIVSDLQWWVNDDDIRGWTHFCGTEDELQDITFSEHKVNGKCKGYEASPNFLLSLLHPPPREQSPLTKSPVKSMSNFSHQQQQPLSNALSNLRAAQTLRNQLPKNIPSITQVPGQIRSRRCPRMHRADKPPRPQRQTRLLGQYAVPLTVARTSARLDSSVAEADFVEAVVASIKVAG